MFYFLNGHFKIGGKIFQSILKSFIMTNFLSKSKQALHFFSSESKTQGCHFGYILELLHKTTFKKRMIFFLHEQIYNA